MKSFRAFIKDIYEEDEDAAPSTPQPALDTEQSPQPSNNDSDKDTDKDTDKDSEDTEDDANKDDKNVIDMNGFMVLKPGFLEHKDELKQKLEDDGWKVVGEETKKLTKDEASEFYKDKKFESYYDDLVDYMSSDDSVCFMLYKEDSKDPIGELSDIKKELRKEWGEDDMKNAIHSSDSFDNMEHEVEIYTSVPDEDEDEDEDTNKEEPEEPEEDTGSLEDEEKPEEMEGPSEPQPAS
jgi:nucleoside-diphosphate kinase